MRLRPLAAILALTIAVPASLPALGTDYAARAPRACGSVTELTPTLDEVVALFQCVTEEKGLDDGTLLLLGEFDLVLGPTRPFGQLNDYLLDGADETTGIHTFEGEYTRFVCLPLSEAPADRNCTATRQKGRGVAYRTVDGTWRTAFYGSDNGLPREGVSPPQ